MADSKYDYDVFLSHAIEDVEWAETLAIRLNNTGLRVLYDSTICTDAKLKRAVKQSRKTLAVWSEHYLRNAEFKKLAERLGKVGIQERPFIPLLRGDCAELSEDVPYLDFRTPADFDFWYCKLIEALDLASPKHELERDEPNDDDPDLSLRGRLNYRKGKRFEKNVAELFRLLEYTVTEDVHLNGVQFDLRIEKDDTISPVKAYVECKDTRVGDEERNQAITQQSVLQAIEKNSRCIVVSSQGFAALALQFRRRMDGAAPHG